MHEPLRSALWPFGRTVVRRQDAGTGALLGNILWIVLFGWWLALEHLLTAIALFITIIGIPLALANLKLIPVSLTPLGRRLVAVRDPKLTVLAIRMAGVPRPLGPANLSPGCLRAAEGNVGVEGQRLVRDETQPRGAIAERLER